jgi:hypothetical protein
VLIEIERKNLVGRNAILCVSTHIVLIVTDIFVEEGTSCDDIKSEAESVNEDSSLDDVKQGRVLSSHKAPNPTRTHRRGIFGVAKGNRKDRRGTWYTLTYILVLMLQKSKLPGTSLTVISNKSFTRR